MENRYYVYILTNLLRTTLYIGVSRDIARRLEQHQHAKVPGFTKKYGVTKLIYLELFQDINTAIQREKQLKNWSRRKKEILISRVNPEWNEIDDLP